MSGPTFSLSRKADSENDHRSGLCGGCRLGTGNFEAAIDGSGLAFFGTMGFSLRKISQHHQPADVGQVKGKNRGESPPALHSELDSSIVATSDRTTGGTA